MHLQPWEPLREKDFFSPPVVCARISSLEKAKLEERALHLIIRRRDEETMVMIGECNFTNIV